MRPETLWLEGRRLYLILLHYAAAYRQLAPSIPFRFDLADSEKPRYTWADSPKIAVGQSHVAFAAAALSAEALSLDVAPWLPESG